MLPKNQPPSPKSEPQKKAGIQFKPWPLLEFLACFIAVIILFVIERFLPRGMVSFSAFMGGTMAGMTLSYLSYCGYSIWASPAKTKITLVLVFIAVAVFTGGLSHLILGPYP